MLFIGIGIFFVVGGLFGIYFASQMKPHLLMRASEKNEGDTGDDPFRGGGVKIEEFIRENIARKILTYVGVLLLLVGAGFIYKAIILEVPANKVAVRYIVTGDFNVAPNIFAEYGPGWYIVSPLRTYLIEDISDLYFNTSQEGVRIKDLELRLKDHIRERDQCWGKVIVWEKAYGKPTPR